MDSIKLARKLKRHDENAFEEIIKFYTPLVSTIVYNICGGRLTAVDIEEVCADVFVTLWKNADRLQENTLKSYLCCIAKSRAKDRLRRERFGDVIDINDIEKADEKRLDENYERKELYAALKEEILTIDEPDREILIRYYYYYQTISKIADALHMNVDTVKSKLRRTRIKLKEKLTDRGF